MSWRKFGLVALTLCYPVVVYVGLQYWPPRIVALFLIALLVLRLAAGKQAGARAMALVAAAVAAVVMASGDAMPLKLYPVFINALMLGLFGWSLRYPPTVVERIARMREPDLPPAGVAYTRKVTIAWCVFFCCNGAVALGTALFADDATWALYNGAIAYVLIGTMFAAEWLVRRRVMAGHRHV
ncbi:COG4648 family protein [Cupriavidus pampae]|uniref:DNA gyrase subunit B n=1 Tax=Cupriavidus pampae TaxID=659251 RepID=A0ABM8XJ71_9BURK|nr:hypothetical protein [Cupriavidus pampae]CAG9180238.1 hypothetical protein LMG32289_04559 [Cupriavidus pampae]